MESIKSAFYSLKNGIVKSKIRPSAETTAALDELAAILDILKLETVSRTAFSRAASLLRDKIQPLYTHDLELTLNFASSVFVGLHTTRVIKAAEGQSRTEWEMLQSSVLSGVLDHLEEHRTAKTKVPIAHAFLAILCKLYIPTSPDVQKCNNSDLLTIVLMLLSEIVCGQGTNAAAFRKELGGGRRLGYSLTTMKDFLPLEAALDLFANISLAIKGSKGRTEKTKWIHEVLNPDVFEAQLLESVINVTNATQWSQVSLDVMKALGSLQMSSPQLFEVSNYETHGFACKSPTTLFLESSTVVCSIPVKGGMETMKVAYSSIKKLAVSSDADGVLVLVSLNSPPVIGKDLVKCSQKELSIQWRLAGQDARRFVGSLQFRNVNLSAEKLEHRRKLSIVPAGVSLPVQLDSDVDPPKPTQDKVLAITQLLWEGSQATRGADGSSSPLLDVILPPNSDDVKAVPPAALQPDSVFIDSNGNLTKDLSDHKENEPGPNNSVEGKGSVKATETKDVLMSKALSVLMSARNRSLESARAFQPKGGAKKRTNVVLSDVESDASDGDELPSPTPNRTKKLTDFKAPTKRPEPKAVATRRASPRLATKSAARNKNPIVEDLKVRVPRTRATEKRPGSVKSEAIPFKLEPLSTTTTVKGKRAPSCLHDDDDEPPLPPAKRQRISPEAKPRPRPTTRYKAKMRSSTPAVTFIDSESEDEPPKAPARRGRAKVEEAKGKKAAMKDKAGKAQPKPRPVNKRKAAAATKQSATHDVKMLDVKPDIKVLEGEKKDIGGKNTIIVEPPVVKNEPKQLKLEEFTPHNKPEARNTRVSVRKPKKAVWQHDSFAANVDALKESTPAKTLVKEEEIEPIEIASPDWRAPEGAFDFNLSRVAEEVVQDMTADTTDTNDASETFVAEPFKEYFVPVKMDDLETSPIPQDKPMFTHKPTEDIIMIDLTSPQGSVAPTPEPVAIKRREIPARKAAKTQKIDMKEVSRAGKFPGRAASTREDHDVAKTVLKASEEVRDQPTRAVPPVDLQAEVEKKHPIKSSKQEEIVNERQELALESHVVDEERSPIKETKFESPLPIGKRRAEEATSRPAKIVRDATDRISPVIKPQKITVSPTGRAELPGNGEMDDAVRDKSPVQPLAVRGVQLRSDTLPPLPPPRKALAISKFNLSRPNFEPSKGSRRAPVAPKKEPLPDIAEILGEIAEALTDRLNQRFEETSRGMSHAQISLLNRAAEDLRPMFQEGVDHFNALVDLEAEYGAHRRKIMTGIDRFNKATNEASASLKSAIQNHGRHSLAKKFPPKLFTKPVPTFQLKV